MSRSTDIPSESEVLAAEEAALAQREAGLILALEDAVLEAAEVRAFAADVSVRLRRHVDAGNTDAAEQLEALSALDLPDLTSLEFEARRTAIRKEAIRARRGLIESIDAELERTHVAVDAALDRVRDARDSMLRGRLRRSIPLAPEPEPAAVSATETVLAPAIAMEAQPAEVQPTRSTGRPPSRPRIHEAPGPATIRENRRRRLETRVDFQSDSNFFSGFSSNISDGGLFIATPQALEVGAELDVTLGLPDSAPMRTRCVVRWVRAAQRDLPAGIGVEFLDLDDAAREIIHRFMKRRDPIFHEV